MPQTRPVSATGILLALLATAACAASGIHATADEAAAATTQYGCSFTVPKPSITNRTASYAVEVTCSKDSTNRRVRVELRADDPSYDDTLQTNYESVGARDTDGHYALTGYRASCQEDAAGEDEVYLRVRVERYDRTSWKSGQWANGPVASGDCR